MQDGDPSLPVPADFQRLIFKLRYRPSFPAARIPVSQDLHKRRGPAARVPVWPLSRPAKQPARVGPSKGGGLRHRGVAIDPVAGRRVAAGVHLCTRVRARSLSHSITCGLFL